jgi:hypothetical protein
MHSQLANQVLAMPADDRPEGAPVLFTHMAASAELSTAGVWHFCSTTTVAITAKIGSSLLPNKLR